MFLEFDIATATFNHVITSKSNQPFMFLFESRRMTCADPEWEGGQWGPNPHPPPLENRKAIGFLSKTGPDPLEYHKATEPAFNDGPLSARL